MHLANSNSFSSPLESGNTSAPKKRLGIGVGVILVGLIAGLLWQMLRPTEASGLMYQGKPLSAWLDEVWYLDGGVDPQAEKAVRQIGTNAIPYLLKLATTRDSTLKAKVSAALPEKWLVGYKTRSAHDHFSAAFGFDALGPAAKSAMPTLMNLLNDKDEDIRICAAHALGSIGPAAQDAIPALIKHLNDPSPYVRSGSADALDNIPPRSAQEVPALIQILNGSPKESDVLFLAIERLGQFQSQAKGAVPGILPYLHDPDIATRDCAAKALKQIDPEEAAKAGIQ